MTGQEHFLLLGDSPEEQQQFKELVSCTAAAIADSLSDDRAYAGPEPEKLRRLIASGTLLPEHGIGWEKMLAEACEKILPNLLRPHSTAYMAHLHSPALLESIASELIIAAFNQSMDSWDQSPAATEVEEYVVHKLCGLYGYGPGSDGVFTSGGSQSNLSGLLLARDRFCNEVLKHDVKKLGLPPEFRKFRLYVSEVSHFSMEKSAHLMGLGYDAVVKVPVDKKMKMDPVLLRQLIARDKAAGLLPFCVCATVGTTDFGSIDPLEECAAVCRENDLWLHADASYGSGVLLSEKYRSRIVGIGLCDSITVDFHKMFLLPISCSASLVKDGRYFDALTLHADYLNREEDEEDGYINLVNKSMQTTRRFDALKVWMSFRMRGADGWSQLMTRVIDNAAYLYRQLKADPAFEVLVEPEISSVVFRVVSQTDADEVNKRIRRTLLHQYGVVIGQTCAEGKTYLKFTLLNPRVTPQKLDELTALILSIK